MTQLGKFQSVLDVGATPSIRRLLRSTDPEISCTILDLVHRICDSSEFMGELIGLDIVTSLCNVLSSSAISDVQELALQTIFYVTATDEMLVSTSSSSSSSSSCAAAAAVATNTAPCYCYDMCNQSLIMGAPLLICFSG